MVGKQDKEADSKYHPVDDLLQRENDTLTMKKVNWFNLTLPMMVQTLIVWIWSWGNRQVQLPNCWPQFSNLPGPWKKKNYSKLKAVKKYENIHSVWSLIGFCIKNAINLLLGSWANMNMESALNSLNAITIL